jgi:enediyne biosynthesis thioesterase
MPAYEHRHVVGFEETSLLGTVYFTNYLLWQGHCREMFLKVHCPDVLSLLERGEVNFLTKSCSCDWRGESGFVGLDDVVVRMRLAGFRGGRMQLEFTYAHAGEPDGLVATGAQEVHCKSRRDGVWVPSNFPSSLIRALQHFADTEELRRALQEALEFTGGTV